MSTLGTPSGVVYDRAIIQQSEFLHETVRRVWGYDRFLPLQEEAIACVVQGRDSVVVLPTGGGKSLCYQAPAANLGRLAIVVSPLIALMKDQVDGLREAGVPAAFLNSSQTPRERARGHDGRRGGPGPAALRRARAARDGRLRPAAAAGRPRHSSPSTRRTASASGATTSGRNTASSRLREAFPGVAVHAYTATATPQVRRDIVTELRLRDPRVLVGSFDRPNLIYRVARAPIAWAQVLAAIGRHRDEAGIMYCIRRSEVDELAAALARRGLKALRYHAGMSDQERRTNQDAFINERVDIVVATVAFGMGIDRSNVRYVIHTGMPKSLEHYQQEAGRAGRDGLEAECLLLVSGADYGLWKSILTPEGAEPPPGALRKLGEMYAFCQQAICRHRGLVTYFGQPYESTNCGACDVCLAETVAGEDTSEVTQKVLAAVAELRGRFGAAHVAAVLAGASTARIRELRHDQLSGYGALREDKQGQVRAWIDQLIGHGYLARTEDEYPTLRLAARGAAVLRGEETAPALTSARAVKATAADTLPPAAAPVGSAERAPVAPDPLLFERLRSLRRTIAEERGVPPT